MTVHFKFLCKLSVQLKFFKQFFEFIRAINIKIHLT